MRFTSKLNIVVLIICALISISSIFGTEVQAQTSQRATELTQVESEYVCMVTDQRFESSQLPVIVNEETYYGCCQGCVSRLNQDTTIRKAVDPVSQDTVDKAKAIIGVDSEGRAYYFESETTFQKFNARVRRREDQNS